MSRWRQLRRSLLVAAVLVLIDPLRSAAFADPGVPVPPGELITDTGSGQLTDADKDLVVKVRLAGLWEVPAGQMAQEKSQNPKIRQIGKDIAAQHVILDKLDRDAAKKLGITLPAQPNKDQQGWLGEMRDADGPAFDQIYIDRLRAAHGKIFPAIATIRSTTRNDTVRKLAQQANQFVATHMTLLESSGIVDFQELPTAPAPSAATSSTPVQAAAYATQPGVSKGVVYAILIAAGGMAVFVTWRLRSTRRRPLRSRSRY